MTQLPVVSNAYQFRVCDGRQASYDGSVQRLVLVLVMATVVVITTGCSQACPVALLTGVLVEQDAELVVISEPGGRPERLLWPWDYRVRREGARLVVVDLFGVVRARAGDRVRIGGGEVEDGTWLACGGIEVVPQPT